METTAELRAPVESEYNVARDAIEKQYITDREALEQQYQEDIKSNRLAKEAALVEAGFNLDGSVPPTFDFEAPVNISAPVVTGTPTTGATLTSTAGVWARADDLTYQWRRAGVDIAGATANTHVLVVGDVGSAITCRVTASNESGSDSAVSNAINAVAP